MKLTAFTSNTIWALLNRFLKISIYLITIYFIIGFSISTFFRIQYPYELEIMETGMVEVVDQILQGQKIYRQPSIEFITFLYTPLYYYVCAFAGLFFGPTFFSLRLISVISILLTFILVFLFLKKETQSKTFAYLGMSLMIAMGITSDFFYDVARLDSFYTLILMSILFVLRFYKSIRAIILVAGLTTLLFYTKQTSFLFIPFFTLIAFLHGRRQGFIFLGTCCGLIIPIFHLLNWIHDGWFNYYIFQMPAGHDIFWPALFLFWQVDVFLPLLIPSLIALWCLFTKFESKNYAFLKFYLPIAIAMIGHAYAGRMNMGGASNVLMSYHLILAILFGIGLHEINKQTKNHHNIHRLFIQILICISFLAIPSQALNPHSPVSLLEQIPRQKDLKTPQKFIEKVKQFDGDVYIPYFGYLAEAAGKPHYANAIALNDVMGLMGGGVPDVQLELINEFKDAFAKHQWDIIIVHRPEWLELFRGFGIQFELIEDLNFNWPFYFRDNGPNYIYRIHPLPHTK